MNPVLLGMAIGSFIALYCLSTLINWIIVRRVLSDPAHQIWASVGVTVLVALFIQEYGGDLSGVRAVSTIVADAVAAVLVLMAKYFPMRKSAADFARVSVTAAVSTFIAGVAALYAISPVAATTALSEERRVDASQPDQVTLDLQAMAAALNDQTPKMVDKATKLLRASVSGRTFTYHYKFMQPIRMSHTVFLARMRAVVLPKVCANPDMRRDLDENAVTYEYAYAVPGNDDDLLLEVSSRDCQK